MRPLSLDLQYPQPCHPERSEGICFCEIDFFTYIRSPVDPGLVQGITNNLEHRLREHGLGEREGFTKRYRVHRLVCFECYRDVPAAIFREKQIKSWRREKKVALIEAANPAWEDLAPESEETADPSLRSV